MYAVGGFNGSLRVRTVDIYDAATDQWSPCPEMEARRSTLGVAVLGNCIYAVNSLYIIYLYRIYVYMLFDVLILFQYFFSVLK